MGFTRSIASAFPKATASTPTFTDGVGWTIAGPAKADRLSWFGTKGTTLGVSTDEGATFTVVKDFSPSSGRPTNPTGGVLLDNGELLVALYTGGSAGELWRSTGWATNPSTATWAMVLRVPFTSYAVQFETHYGGVSPAPGTGIVVVSEYGWHTNDIENPNNVTAAIAGNTMTVTAVGSATLAVGKTIFAANVIPGTKITALGTGTGGNGTYTLNNAQTVASSALQAGDALDPARAAVRVYVSTDNGATFGGGSPTTPAVIFRLDQKMAALGYDVPNCPFHLHGALYDPYWDRIWCWGGDQTVFNGTPFIFYSDDWRNATPTWTLVPNSSAQVNTTQPGVYQSTGAVAMEKALIFGSDGTPAGVFRIPRRGYRQMGPVECAHMVNGGNATSILGSGIWSVDATRDSPTFVVSQHATNLPVSRVSCTLDGLDFFDVAVDPTPPSVGNPSPVGGFYTAFLTPAKKLIGTSKGDRPAFAASGNRARYTLDLSAVLP